MRGREHDAVMHTLMCYALFVTCYGGTIRLLAAMLSRIVIRLISI